LEARGLVRTTEFGGYDQVKVLGSAIKMSGMRGDEVPPKVPELGEHTAEVLGRIGIGSAQLEELRKAGVV
jgi:crotonobetainyl-CoA:carnitine CoA-transferase CaiB-like acyl-CoA transferase